MNRIWRSVTTAATNCFFLVCVFVAPFAFLLDPAGTAAAAASTPGPAADSAQNTLSREDRLLLLDNVAKLWQVGIVGIGAEEPYNSEEGRFGLLREDQLAPAFIQAQSLMLTVHFGTSGQVPRLAPDEIRPSQAKEQEALFKNIPERFTMYYPYAALEEAALSYLGRPLGPFGPAEGVLKTEQGLYVDLDWWYGSDGPIMKLKRDTAFAAALADYPDNDGWGMEGQVRLIAPGDDTIMRVVDSAGFHVRARKAGAHWRIHTLIFVPQQGN